MSVSGAGNAGAALMARMVGQLGELAQQDRKDAAKDLSEQNQLDIEKTIESADRTQIAARQDYAFQNLDGTVGQIPIAGKIGVTIATAGQQDQEFLGGMALLAGPVYAPVGLALLASSQLRPQVRDALEAQGGPADTNSVDNNSLLSTFAYADRADRDKNKDLAKRAEIDAKRASKEASEAKTSLDDAKKNFDEIVQNMRTVLEDSKRAVDKIQA